MPRTIVVVPCFNEEQRLDLDAFRSHRTGDIRFLFVDDGSTDGTVTRIEELVSVGPDRFELLKLDRNVGKAEAVRRGFAHAFESAPDLIGFLDADLSTGLEEVGRFLDVLDRRPEVVGVIGSRVRLLGRRVERRAGRHYAGRVFATLVSLALRLPVYDTQCGAKFFRNGAVVRQAFEKRFRSRWVFDVELLARLAASARRDEREPGDLVVELPLMAWRDVPGSKLRLRHGVRALFDLWRIRRQYRS